MEREVIVTIGELIWLLAGIFIAGFISGLGVYLSHKLREISKSMSAMSGALPKGE